MSASATQTGPSQAEPEVSALRASVPCAGIRVNWKHIDGPMMVLPDGQLRWLTLRERFMHWIGRWSLEDIARRPGGLSKLVYYPPHDTWLSLPAASAIDARRAETGNTGSVHERAVPKGDAQ